MSDTLEQVKTASTAAFKDGFEKLQAAMGEATAHGKANYEAMVSAGQIVAKGAEEVTGLAAAYTKQAFEKGMEAFKAVAAAKSVQEAVELQADYAKTSLETYLAEFNKVTDVWTGVAKEAAKPLSERASAVVAAMQSAK